MQSAEAVTGVHPIVVDPLAAERAWLTQAWEAFDTRWAPYRNRYPNGASLKVCSDPIPDWGAVPNADPTQSSDITPQAAASAASGLALVVSHMHRELRERRKALPTPDTHVHEVASVTNVDSRAAKASLGAHRRDRQISSSQSLETFKNTARNLTSIALCAGSTLLGLIRPSRSAVLESTPSGAALETA